MFLSWSTRISLTMERHNSRLSGIDKESYTLSKSIFKKFFKYDKSLTGRESSAFIFSSCISNFSLSSLNSSIVMRSFKYRSFNFCIVELEDDWEQRLNPFNLIPLNHKTHNTITALYKQSKASMRATQKQLRSLIEYHFREAGGYKKVLCDSFLVAPPLLFGENSPREFQQKGTSERGVRM